ncbi:hypothetical protein BGZ68_009484 [Mortierella alpina]|nr:hypothetical protein BGZ68_009484 [Mortierella alpina]
MEALNRFTRWNGNSREAKQSHVGIFNIILGLSLASLNMDCVESISFSFGTGAAHAYGPLEHFEWKPMRDGFTVEMEVRTTSGTSKAQYPGFVEMHYMELDALQTDHSDDPTTEVHQPFKWSIDVAHTACLRSGIAAPRSADIMHHAVSGNGKYAATVSVLDNVLQLDLWDLESGRVHPALSEYSVLNIEPWKPFYPALCAQVRWPLLNKIYSGSKSFVVSISWDASVVALMSDSTRYLEYTLYIYQHERVMQLSAEKGLTPSANNKLIPFEGSGMLPEMRAKCNAGKFHIIADKDPDVKDELFVICDGVSVTIYSIHGQWNHVRTIWLMGIETGVDKHVTEHRLIDGIRSKYFSWTDSDGTLIICDLETGLLVSRIPKGRNACFSDDGALVTMRHSDSGLTTRWTQSGIVIAAAEGARANPIFLPGDSSRVLLPLYLPDETFGRGQLGVIMDATTLSATGRSRLSIPVLRPELKQQRIRSIAGCQYIYTFYGSKLDMFKLDDLAVTPHGTQRGLCTANCYEEQSAIQDKIIPGTTTRRDFLMASGLAFSATFSKPLTDEWSNGPGRHSISVAISNGQTTLPDALVIPAATMGDIPAEQLESKVVFDEAKQEMIIYSDIFIMVWGLPTTIDGAFTLLLAWWTQIAPFSLDRRNDWCGTTISQCSHQNYYLAITELDAEYEDVIVDMQPISTENAFSYVTCPPFLNGILVLISFFGLADEALKRAIVRYVGQYLNTYPEPDDLSKGVMAQICENVTQDNHVQYVAFLQALLDSDHGRWVPHPGYTEKSNPACIILRSAERWPRVIDLLQVLIRYCTRMASKEKDLQFVLPLMEPLHKLLKQKQLYSEVARSLLQGLAFLPAKDRAYIIEHHSIAHPPSLRLNFWRPNQQKLYECKDPVLQLDRDPLSKNPDPKNDNFTSDLFVASFDMLWQAPHSLTESSICDVQATQSLVSMFFHMIKLNLKLKSRTSIRCNDFALESLDNPAIVALVEYKWNTIGFTYWLYRFFFQCIYYFLVLTAVFMQVYSSSQGSSLFGVFVAIIVLSVVFLWFELVQMSHNWRRFWSSPYNYADVATFVLPLAGSILQLFNITNERDDGQVYLLSFSVLFIFIHFLFELRISKTVCHFVTIIIRIIGEIRVFFIVFSAGIIAFTIAILHMLHACPTDGCKRAQSKFPLHFFGAFSSTYFFMGGRYDSVSDEFDEQEWSFHAMMIIYFFFTAILLLNVLIALINVAFEVGDNNWRMVWLENRLAYVESAENMTYHIPGFRQAHNWFPREIYYSSPISKVRDYKAKHLNSDEETGASLRLFGHDSKAKATPDTAANKFAAILTLHQERETKDKEFQQAVIDSMRRELQISQTHLSALQSQVREQQQSFEAQIRELKLADATEVRELKNLLVSVLERGPKK